MPAAGKHPDVDWIDVVGHMLYLQESYNAETDMGLFTEKDDVGNAVLCLSIVAQCGNTGHEPVTAYTARRVDAASLRRLPEVVLDTLYQLGEEIDGQCIQCRKAAGRV